MSKFLESEFQIRANKSNTTAKKRHAFGKIPAKDLKLRMELQDWKCFYCDQVISLFTCELEHIYPISRGGEHFLHNIVLSCRLCNQIKGRHTLQTFCKRMNLDCERIRQKITELNQLQDNLTNFDDEYGNEIKSVY